MELSLTEVAYMLYQDRLLQKATGLFPAVVNISPRSVIVNINCGAGGWALDVAHALPNSRVLGFDRAAILAHAKTFAQVEQVKNVVFQDYEMGPLPLEDNSVDFVYARLLSNTLLPGDWLPLLRECWRVLRVRGICCFTDYEFGVSSSYALDQCQHIFDHGLFVAKRSLSKDGWSRGTTAYLRSFFQQSGFQHCRYESFVLDCSYDQPYYQSSLDFHLRHQFGHFFLELTRVHANELNTLYQQATQDMRQKSFTWLKYYLTVFGEKG